MELFNKLEVKLITRAGIFFLFLLILTLFFGKMIYLEVIDSVYENSFKGAEDKKLIIFGDSHAATGLNPEFIEGSFNLSVLSEPLYYTKYRIHNWYKKKNIKNILLSLSYHNISEKKADRKYERQFMDRYYYFIKNEKMPINKLQQYIDYGLCRLKFDFGIPLFGKNYFMDYIFCQDCTFYGMGYQSNDKCDLGKDNTKYILNQLYNSNSRVSESEINLIKNIAEYCYKNGISLNVISTPLHEDYIDGVPDNIKTAFEKLIDDLISEYNVKYHDFMDFAMSDEEYIDADHLNYEGAKRLSMRVRREMGIVKKTKLGNCENVRNEE